MKDAYVHTDKGSFCVCAKVLAELIQEVLSEQNQKGTQKKEGTENPNIHQLVYHYVDSGAMQGFIDNQGIRTLE